MVSRISIFGNKRSKRWRANFTAAPFEVKTLSIIVVLIALASFLVFLPNNVGEIATGIATPGGGTFMILAAADSLRLLSHDQTLKVQLGHRIRFTASSLMILVFYCMGHAPFRHDDQSAEVFRLICLYRPYYNFWLPLFMILVMSARTVPMAVKYFKLPKEEQLKSQTD
jgi:hypothetical protein